MRLIERVQLGEITVAQFEQLTGFLDAERLGLTDRVYKPETARRRRALAKKLGVSPADAETEPLDVSLDELLECSALGLDCRVTELPGGRDGWSPSAVRRWARPPRPKAEYAARGHRSGSPSSTATTRTFAPPRRPFTSSL